MRAGVSDQPDLAALSGHHSRSCLPSTRHPKGSPPRPIGRYVSVSDAARKLGVTRQEAKRILGGRHWVEGRR